MAWVTHGLAMRVRLLGDVPEADTLHEGQRSSARALPVALQPSIRPRSKIRCPISGRSV